MESISLGSFFRGFTQNAKGGIYEGAGISAFSSRVVDRPTIFPFARGIGLMGEAGPEAILPLRRGTDGTLGVISSSASGTGVVINIIESQGKGGQQTQRTDSQGTQIIDVWVEQITAKVWGDVARGSGPGPSVLANTYGLNRVAGSY